MTQTTTHSLPSLAPLAQSERISIIDSLRGIALLGILMMNIPYFGLPEGLATNPVLANEMGTVNFRVWYFIEWFLEGSQRAIFSMLFGCGVLVFTTRLEARVSGIMPAELFLRRQLWLLLFGLINAFVFLWGGDILYHYAICGIILFAFRRVSPRYLILAAVITLAFQTMRENRDIYLEKGKVQRGETIAAMDTTVTKLTPKQKDQLHAMNDFKNEQKLESKRKNVDKEIAAVQGNYGDLYDSRSRTSVWFETTFMYFNLWDILVFMFLGLAFFKLGIIQGESTLTTYVGMTVLGLGVGLFISFLRLQSFLAFEFNFFEITKNTNFAFYEISRFVRAIGIFGFIMVLYKSGWFKWLFSLMRPVGQMAFTNYLMQSMICGILFYGVGFGLFGRLQRYELYYVVASIWLFQIIASNIWLRYYRFGPMEWLWRSLTYWKIQPIKKNTTIEPAVAESVQVNV